MLIAVTMLAGFVAGHRAGPFSLIAGSFVAACIGAFDMFARGAPWWTVPLAAGVFQAGVALRLLLQHVMERTGQERSRSHAPLDLLNPR